MNTGIIKRMLSVLLVAMFLMPLGFGALKTALADKPTAGRDGSAEMNEAYADHESLMPIGPSFNIPSLLEWTPETDPDAKYSRASIALPEEKRVTGYLVNPKASRDAKLMLCSLGNTEHDVTSSQGGEEFTRWAFNYWQYVDTFIYWAGSEEGIICCPTGEFIDAAHTNGVPIIATLGFPWGTGNVTDGYSYADQVADFCAQAEDGSFPVADKLIEVMDFYGFDGYFFNQESYGSNSEVAKRLNEMMRYMHRERPDMLIAWYDSMASTTGGVNYQDAVTSVNSGWMTPVEDGVWGVDEFMMNYNWNRNKVSTTISTMKEIGRSQFDAFAGLDVQQNGMNTKFDDYLLLDDEGRLKLSLALYCPNSTLGNAVSGENFHEVEREFYVNRLSDPRAEVSDPTLTSNTDWVGMSRFFADKTAITSVPFVTNFNTGHGRGYWVDGVLSRDTEWNYQSVQDILPTWTFIIDSTGEKLEGAYDFQDAYNGGNSLSFSGTLSANKPNDIMLYSTSVTVNKGCELSLTYKNDEGKMKLVAYYEDGATTDYASAKKRYYDLPASKEGEWKTTSVEINPGKLIAIGLKIESKTQDPDYKVNIGELTILDQYYEKPAAPTGFTLSEILYHTAYEAEARVYWEPVEGAASYEVYMGSKLIMETPNTALYIPTLKNADADGIVTLTVVAKSQNGERGNTATLSFDWQYGPETSEAYEPASPDNLCLNADIIGYSAQGESEPAQKALDGTAKNGSKWCAAGVTRGWMAIDLGKEVQVQRWRIEHAEYGGESSAMNTRDFSLQYWTGTGTPTGKETSGWTTVQAITGNTAAVTDEILESPVKARYWKLDITLSDVSAWHGVRIYEWQMFDSTELSKTKPVMMHLASAENNSGAHDTFTLKAVPPFCTVNVYNADNKLIGTEYTAEGGTVVLNDLDFGTDTDGGRVYYTTTALASAESPKASCEFYAVNAEKSPRAANVSFDVYSHPGSVTSSNGDDIFVNVTVKGLREGDTVYLYEGDASDFTRMSTPVAYGKTSVTIERVRVPRHDGELRMQIKRPGMPASDIYTVKTGDYPDPVAKLQLNIRDESGNDVKGASFALYDQSGKLIGNFTNGTLKDIPLDDRAYVIKCLSVPDEYIQSRDILKIINSENKEYKVNVLIRTKASVVMGDVNQNGQVETADATLILRYLVRLIDSSGIDLYAADMNADGVINSGDAAAILRYLVK